MLNAFLYKFLVTSSYEITNILFQSKNDNIIYAEFQEISHNPFLHFSHFFILRIDFFIIVQIVHIVRPIRIVSTGQLGKYGQQ